MGRGAALPERRGSVISSTKWLPHTTVDTVQYSSSSATVLYRKF